MVATNFLTKESFALDTQADWLDIILGEHRSTVPQVWAIGGITQGVGYSTITSILFAQLWSKNHDVAVLSPEGALSGLSSFPPDDLYIREPKQIIKNLINSLDKDVSNDFEKIYRSLNKSVWPAAFQRYYIVDLGASISHESLDVFLSADVPVIVMDAHTETVSDLIVFLNACLLRLLEVCFPDYKKQLYALAQQVSKRKNIQAEIVHLVSTFHSREPQLFEQIRSAFAPKLVINRSTPHEGRIFYQNYMNTSSHYYLPDITFAGTLANNSGTHVLSVLKRFFIHTENDSRLADLENCLKEKYRRLVGRSRYEDTCARIFY
jgi:hypothetical protein